MPLNSAGHKTAESTWLANRLERPELEREEGVQFLQQPFTVAMMTRKVREVLDETSNEAGISSQINEFEYAQQTDSAIEENPSD